MKKFRELREDWRIGKLEKEIFQREATSTESDYKGVNIETSEDRDASVWTNRQAEYRLQLDLCPTLNINTTPT